MTRQTALRPTLRALSFHLLRSLGARSARTAGFAASFAFVLALAALLLAPSSAAADDIATIEAEARPLAPAETAALGLALQDAGIDAENEAAGAAGVETAMQLSIDRGCGASYPLGAPIRIYLGVSQAGYYELDVISAAGTRSYRYYLYAGWSALQGVVGQPAGPRTLRLRRGLSQVSCGFQAGTAPAAPSGPALERIWTMDEHLRTSSCLPSGGRAYLGARVRNGGAAPSMVTVSMLVRGRIGTYTLEHIETLTLQPGEVRDLHGFADGLADRSYDYLVLLHQQGQEAARADASFRVGGC